MKVIGHIWINHLLGVCLISLGLGILVRNSPGVYDVIPIYIHLYAMTFIISGILNLIKRVRTPYALCGISPIMMQIILTSFAINDYYLYPFIVSAWGFSIVAIILWIYRFLDILEMPPPIK